MEPNPATNPRSTESQEPERARGLTFARVLALGCIALVAVGLAYLRFGPGDERVSVPAGAQAGQLSLESCDYSTRDGTFAADCGTLVVPEYRADPQSRLIALPVTRIRSRSASPAAPLFRLEGGPGKTNMKFPYAGRYAETRDVVLVGYRGVDGSSRLGCPEVDSALKHSKDLTSESSFRAYRDGLRDCAERLTGDGADLRGYSLAQRVEDLEAARVALGYPRIDLVSESAGTRTALIYAWRHPERIRRSVMIGVNPPGHFLWDPATTNEQFRRYSRLCAADESCSGRTDDLAAAVERVSADPPDHWFFLPIKEGNVRLATFFGLAETTSEAAPLSGPMTLGSWISADDGDASGLWFDSLLADIAFPTSFVWGELAAAARADANFARHYFATRRADDDTNIGHAANEFIWGGGKLLDAWPATPDEDDYDRVRPSAVETLLINGALDFATPPQQAAALLPHLSNGRQVVLPGFGHSTTFWEDQSAAGTHLVETYLDSGRVDRSRYEPQRVDFTPEVTQTALGKGTGGAMVGLALLTVLSLLAMLVRLTRTRRYGRTASTLLRTLYPVVLGFGGWFLGVVLVVTTMPGVALDDPVLAVVSVGLPVWLCVYLAWSNDQRRATVRAAGFAAAAAGALVGGWLGFNTADDLLALLTTIAGAIAGANLALVAVDVAHDRRRRAGTEAPAAHGYPAAG